MTSFNRITAFIMKHNDFIKAGRERNPYHEPAGSPKGGQFASKPGSSERKKEVKDLKAEIQQIHLEQRSIISRSGDRPTKEQSARLKELSLRMVTAEQKLRYLTGGIEEMPD